MNTSDELFRYFNIMSVWLHCALCVIICTAAASSAFVPKRATTCGPKAGWAGEAAWAENLARRPLKVLPHKLHRCLCALQYFKVILFVEF